MSNPPPLILASASPRRQDLLRSLGVEFRVIPGMVEELHDEALDATALCRINAERKAEEIARAHPSATVLGADTLVARNGRIYGKPRTLDQARGMLAELAGGSHEVITAVCLFHTEEKRRETFADRTVVKFRPLPPSVIEEYIRLVPVLDKAGAYGIQDRGEMLVEGIEGSFTNVMGLPTEKLAETLTRWGYSPRTR